MVNHAIMISESKRTGRKPTTGKEKKMDAYTHKLQSNEPKRGGRSPAPQIRTEEKKMWNMKQDPRIIKYIPKSKQGRSMSAGKIPTDTG